MVAPALPEREALRRMVDEFAAAIRERPAAAHRRPRRACACSSILEAAAAQPRAAAAPWSTSLRAPAERMERDRACRLARRARPGHRRRRHDRLDHRRPARRRRARPRSSCSTTSSAAAGPTSTEALASGRGRGGRGRHPRPGRWSRDADAGHGPGLPPGRDPDHPVRRGAPAGLEVLVDGTFNVVEAAAAAGVAQGRRRVVGVGLRPGRGVPDHRAAPPVQQRHVLRRGQGVQRGHAAQLPRDVRASTTSRCATSTSTARGWTSTASTPRC